jgi:FkbM family methyltransferase
MQVTQANVPELGQFEFYVHDRQDLYISRDLLQSGIWEAFETRVFCRLCRQDDIVADIGANIGWYTSLAGRVIGDGGRVFAYEPDPTNFALLLANVENTPRKSQIQTCNIALADNDTPSTLFLCPSNLGDHRLFDDGTAREAIAVRVDTLDRIFGASTFRPTIVKSDTQGSEARILRGGSGMFDDGWRPIMILEFWPFGLTHAGDSPAKLYERLAELGYEMFELAEESPKLVPVSRERLMRRIEDDIAPRTQGYTNLLCLPWGSERRESISHLIVNA